MTKSNKYTEELDKVLTYIYETLFVKYPNKMILPYHFILGFLGVNDCEVYNFLSKKLMQTQIDKIKEQCFNKLENLQIVLDKEYTYDEIIENTECLKNANNTLTLFKSIINNCDFIKIIFRGVHITTKNITKYENEINNSDNKTISNKTQKSQTYKGELSETEKHLINLNFLAEEGKIQEAFNVANIYKQIFRVFLKKENNNVTIVGDSGVGKSTIVKNIANIIKDPFNVYNIKGMRLMAVDFQSLLNGLMFKGAFESKITSIINVANSEGGCIFFIDDVDVWIENTKYMDIDIESVINTILNNNKIRFICTTSNKGFNKINDKCKLSTKSNVIRLEEATEEDTFTILKLLKKKYEKYHDVIYSDNILKQCVSLSKRYLTEKKLPSSAIEIIDEVGADIRLNEKEDKSILNLIHKLKDIKKEKELCKDINKIDDLTKKELELTSLIFLTKKSFTLNKTKYKIKYNDICKIISEKTNIPLNELSKDDKLRLKDIENIFKKEIIGQDDAIDEVCRVIKRQRLGLSSKNKPAVLFFAGSTGTGKTFLSKKIAEKIFGNEKYLIRLDMSEYSDKMSVSKLIGSSQGYVGYEDGSVLTNTIKKNKYCVLLLDECEKADDSVFNIFLQIFDEGRLTDNKGNLLDFRNTIIILTSNIGAQEINERNCIGFNSSTNKIDFEHSIFNKSLKKRFKPEFLNRIDKIIYFNKLNGDNLKKIIKLELDNSNNKLKEIGYSIDVAAYPYFIEKIFENIKDDIDYGARPIKREIEKVIIDKITDLLLVSNYKKGYKFKLNDIFC